MGIQSEEHGMPVLLAMELDESMKGIHVDVRAVLSGVRSGDLTRWTVDLLVSA